MTTFVVVACVLLAILVIAKTAVVVPQQNAYVVEFLGKYNRTLEAGFHLLVPFAERIRAEVDIPVIAVGLITEPAQAEAILANGQADMVALARGMLWNPRWPWHAAAELGASVSVPRPYWRAQPRAFKDVFGPISFGQR